MLLTNADKIEPAAIRARLERRARWLRVKVVVMLLVGVPLSLVGPVLLGTMFWFAAFLMGYWWPWWWFFAGAVIVVIPLLYLLEMRSGANYLSAAVKGGSPSAAAGLWVLAAATGNNTFRLAAVVANPRASAAGFVELFLFGPRQVVEALRLCRAAWLVRSADLKRASQIIAAMVQVHQGLPVNRLAVKGETVAMLLPTLTFLVFHDWIGISANGDRVWVLSDAREVLQG